MFAQSRKADLVPPKVSYLPDSFRQMSGLSPQQTSVSSAAFDTKGGNRTFAAAANSYVK